MTVDPLPPQCVRVLFCVKQCLVVGGPLKIGGGVVNLVVKVFTTFQIEEPQVVKATTNRVDTVDRYLVIGADLESANREIFLAFGQLVDVQKDFFFRIH